MRRAAILLASSFTCSYVAANLRPLGGAESSVADLSMLSLASWLGVLLLAHDGLVDPDRTMTLLRRIVWWTAVVSVLGVFQFATKQLYVDRISILGLEGNSTLGDLGVRGGFSRASGTALHAIEFGAVLTLFFPLSLAIALCDTDRGLVRRWVPVVAISFAVAVSVSRSAIVGAATGVLLLLPALSRQARIALVALGALFGTLVFLAIPGLTGTILGLFTGISDDPSVDSRVGSYPMAFEYVQQSPLFGRGFGTFLPAYRILDNEYLLLSIEAGLLGLAATVVLLVVGATTGLAVHGDTRPPAVGVGAGIGAGALQLAFFDGFSFPMFSGLLFMAVGIAGALHRQGQLQAGNRASWMATGRHSSTP